MAPFSCQASKIAHHSRGRLSDCIGIYDDHDPKRVRHVCFLLIQFGYCEKCEIISTSNQYLPIVLVQGPDPVPRDDL